LKKKVDKKNFKSAFEKESKLLKEKHTKEIQEFDEQLQKQKNGRRTNVQTRSRG